MRVQVNTAGLLYTLRANRRLHVEEYEQADRRYRKAIRAWFLAQAHSIEHDRDFERHFTGPAPRSYADDYDRAIGMLELHQSDTIDLGADDYRQLVKDDWNWKRDFLATNASYR